MLLWPRKLWVTDNIPGRQRRAAQTLSHFTWSITTRIWRFIIYIISQPIQIHVLTLTFSQAFCDHCSSLNLQLCVPYLWYTGSQNWRTHLWDSEKVLICMQISWLNKVQISNICIPLSRGICPLVFLRMKLALILFRGVGDRKRRERLVVSDRLLSIPWWPHSSSVMCPDWLKTMLLPVLAFLPSWNLPALSIYLMTGLVPTVHDSVVPADNIL